MSVVLGVCSTVCASKAEPTHGLLPQTRSGRYLVEVLPDILRRPDGRLRKVGINILDVASARMDSTCRFIPKALWKKSGTREKRFENEKLFFVGVELRPHWAWIGDIILPYYRLDSTLQ